MGLIEMLLAAIAALTGAVVYLYGKLDAQFAACINREKSCEDRYDNLLVKVVRLEVMQNVYHGAPEQAQAAKRSA